MAIAPEELVFGINSNPANIINSIVVTNMQYVSATALVSIGSGVSSIGYRYYKVGTTAGSYAYTSSTTLTMSGLTSGDTYNLEVVPFEMPNGAGEYGITKRITFTTLKIATPSATTVETVNTTTLAGILAASQIGLSNKTVEEDPSESGTSTPTATSTLPTGSAASSLKPTNSVFQLSNNNTNPKTYISAEKQFSKVDASKTYYAFGTTIFLKSSGDDLSHSGGFMFFSSNNGRQGYFVSVESSALAAVNKRDPFKIYKVKDGNMYPLDDSQDVQIGKFGAVFGGQAYRVDILVKSTINKVTFTIYINGFRIVATDTLTNDATESVLSPTNKLSLICSRGTVYFDYVYGMNVKKEDYGNSKTFAEYGGKFSNALVSAVFGSNVITSPTSTQNAADIDEFGAVAREIRQFKIKYKSPSFPAYPTVGANNMVKIIGKKMNSFNAEIFVLNNSGTFIPLVDNDANSLWLLGKSVSKSGYSEYVDDSLNKYNTPYPVTFESKWIQKNSDAVALADWIKGTWGSKKQVVNLELFGNPLLSVGDVIKIHYPYNDMDGSSSSVEKYVITKVDQRYSEGLTTSIFCRSL